MSRVIILAGVLVMTASLAQAQVSTGTNISGKESSSMVDSIGWVERVPSPMEEKKHAEALRAGRLMAECTAGRRPGSVSEILSSSDANRFNAAMKKLQPVMGPCLVNAVGMDASKTMVSFSRFDLMGMLADAVLVRVPAPTYQTVPVAAVPRAPQWIAGNMGQAVMLQVATCLAHTQPERAQAVIWAKAESPQESEAFGQLIAYLPACLDKNVTLKATKPALRLALATALYQRKINPAPAPAGRAEGGE